MHASGTTGTDEALTTRTGLSGYLVWSSLAAALGGLQKKMGIA